MITAVPAFPFRRVSGPFQLTPGLEARPRTAQGLPVGVIQQVGEDSQLVLNEAQIVACHQERHCGICAEALEHGQPRSFLGGLYTQPAMHSECARAALAWHPELSRQHQARHAGRRPHQGEPPCPTP